MAWYRIAENVLNAIANAINEKTGRTAPMTPVDMVSEIQSIQTGGGGTRVYTKLGEYNLQAGTSVFDITLTEQMKNCEALYMVLNDVTLSVSDWLYPSLNSPTGAQTAGLGYFSNSELTYSGLLAFLPIKAPSGFTSRACSSTITFQRPSQQKLVNDISVIGLIPYTNTTTFQSGTIEIWGYV